MNNLIARIFAGLALLCATAPTLHAADRRVFHSRVHSVLAHLQPLGRLPETDRLNLVIGVPLSHQPAFNALLQQLYDPASTNYHHYLSPAQINAQFGPADADYQTIINFATTNGFQITGEYPNHLMIDVSGTVAQIEKAFQITLHTYQHPTEARQFYAPDVEASVDASIPILDVSGLDNFVIPHPVAHLLKSKNGGPNSASNNYKGYDFRNAFVPGVNLKGAGQNVGLYEGEGYFYTDITNYETQFGLPNVPLQNFYYDNYNSGNTPQQTDTNGVLECSLDMEMVMSMAPNLSKLYIFMGNNSDHVLGGMITNAQIKTFSSSWGMTQDATGDQDFQIMQAQGQSFFDASGDGDAYVVSPIPNWPADDPNVTSVGGTALTMYGDSSGFTSYDVETVWNDGRHTSGGPWNNGANDQTASTAYWGSGGGVSSIYSIPYWQQSVNMSAVGGSTSARNFPDVAMPGVFIWCIYDDGIAGGAEGTSCAAPLWAGFTALVDEQAADDGLPSVGFLNPALYSIGLSSSYTNAFHDVTSGSNAWSQSSGKYVAATGYDLCTGWGSPNGQGMINALLNFAGPIFVNFSSTATPQTGTFQYPFTTIAGTTAAVGNSGTIIIVNGGSTTEKPVISSPMTIRVYNNVPATIGN